MCIAVRPNTDDSCLGKQKGPEKPQEHHKPRKPRDPLDPMEHLPWGNCYHSAFDNLLVRIPELPEGTGRYVLPVGERRRHSKKIGADFVNLAARQSNIVTVKRSNEPVQIASTSQAPLQHPPRVSLWAVMGEAVMSIGPVSYELDSVSEVTDPEEFMQQQRYLIQT